MKFVKDAACNKKCIKLYTKDIFDSNSHTACLTLGSPLPDLIFDLKLSEAVTAHALHLDV